MHVFTLYSLAAIILATLSYTNASMFNSQPQFTIKAVNHKAFDNSCLVETFKIKLKWKHSRLSGALFGELSVSVVSNLSKY
jgi:hypothetical protein